MNRLIGILFLLITVVSCGGGVSGGSAAAPSTPSSVPVAIEFADGKTDVATDSSFTRTFDAPIDPATVTDSSFFVVIVADANIAAPFKSLVSKATTYDATVCDVSSALAQTLSVTSDNLTVESVPAVDLADGTSYAICSTEAITYTDGTPTAPMTVTVTTAAADSGGGGDGGGTTGTADTTAPTCTISPTNGSTVINTAASIYLECDETISLASGAIVVSGTYTGTISGSWSMGANSSAVSNARATFTPSSTLHWDSVTVTVTASKVTDSSSNTMAADSNVTFTVNQEIEDFSYTGSTFANYWSYSMASANYLAGWFFLDANGLNWSKTTATIVGSAGVGGEGLYYLYLNPTFTDTSVSLTIKFNDITSFNSTIDDYADRIFIGFMDASDSTKVFWGGPTSILGAPNGYGAAADNGVDGSIGLLAIGLSNFDIWIKMDRSGDTFAATYKTTEAGAWTDFSGGGVTTTGIGTSYKIVIGVYDKDTFTFNTNSLAIDWDP